MDTDVTELLDRYSRNYPAFKQQLDQLEQEHPGQYAVMADGVIHGIFETEDAAIAAGPGFSKDFAIFKIERRRLRFAVSV